MKISFVKWVSIITATLIIITLPGAAMASFGSYQPVVNQTDHYTNTQSQAYTYVPPPKRNFDYIRQGQVYYPESPAPQVSEQHYSYSKTYSSTQKPKRSYSYIRSNSRVTYQKPLIRKKNFIKRDDRVHCLALGCPTGYGMKRQMSYDYGQRLLTYSSSYSIFDSNSYNYNWSSNYKINSYY